MQIILLEKVVNVGNLGDVVKVKQGYARNFLIPQGKAKRATPENIKLLEAKRAELEAAAAAQARRRAQEQAAKLEGYDRQRDAEGRRRRPAVRLGHQRRHRRSAEDARVHRREGVDPDADRAAEAGRRSSARRRRAFRRGVEHHRSRDRRDRRGHLIGELRKQYTKRAGDGPFCFSGCILRGDGSSASQRNDSNLQAAGKTVAVPSIPDGLLVRAIARPLSESRCGFAPFSLSRRSRRS